MRKYLSFILLIILTLSVFISCDNVIVKTNVDKEVLIDADGLKDLSPVWQLKTTYLDGLAGNDNVTGEQDWHTVSVESGSIAAVFSDGYWLLELRGQVSANDTYIKYYGKAIVFVSKDGERFSVPVEPTGDTGIYGQYLNITINEIDTFAYNWKRKLTAIDVESSLNVQDDSDVDYISYTLGTNIGPFAPGKWSIEVRGYDKETNTLAYIGSQEINITSSIITSNPTGNQILSLTLSLSDHEHNFTYTTNGDASHTKKCTICGLTEIEEHSWKWINTLSDIHYKECSICHEEKDETRGEHDIVFSYYFDSEKNELKISNICNDCLYDANTGDIIETENPIQITVIAYQKDISVTAINTNQWLLGIENKVGDSFVEWRVNGKDLSSVTINQERIGSRDTFTLTTVEPGTYLIECQERSSSGGEVIASWEKHQAIIIVQ